MHRQLTRGVFCGAIGVDSNSPTNNEDNGNNNQEDSSTNGETTETINTGKWIDFRTTPIEDLELEYTDGVVIKRDLERGLWASGTGEFFGRGVKFRKYQWKRSDELPFSFIFTVRGTNPSFLFGIGSTDIDVNNLGSQSLFAGETQLFYDNGIFNRFFGGSGIRNWAQNVQANIKFEDDVFYKVTFEKSGKVGSLISIHRISTTDFDTNLEQLGNYEIVENPADAEYLIPYWNAVSTPDVFIRAIK